MGINLGEMPKRDANVQRAMKALDESINLLQGHVQELESRLSSVLMPDLPREVDERTEEGSPRSTLANTLYAHNGQVLSAVDFLTTMLGRLDV